MPIIISDGQTGENLSLIGHRTFPRKGKIAILEIKTEIVLMLMWVSDYGYVEDEMIVQTRDFTVHSTNGILARGFSLPYARALYKQLFEKKTKSARIR